MDEAVCEQARAAMAAARRAEYAVLESVRTLAAAGVAEAGGYRSAEALIQDLWRVDLGEARRLIRAARALCGSIGGLGDSIEPACPAAGKAAASGVLDRGHVRVIDDAMTYLERVPGLDPAALTEAEEFLVEHAATLTPRGLMRVAAALIAKLDEDGIAPEDEPEPTDELRIVRRKDGIPRPQGPIPQPRGRRPAQRDLRRPVRARQRRRPPRPRPALRRDPARPVRLRQRPRWHRRRDRPRHPRRSRGHLRSDRPR